jgi:hypothetical protein
LKEEKLVGKVVFKYRSIGEGRRSSNRCPKLTVHSDLLRVNGIAPRIRCGRSQDRGILQPSQQLMENMVPQASSLGKRKAQTPVASTSNVVIDIEEELERMETEEVRDTSLL